MYMYMYMHKYMNTCTCTICTCTVYTCTCTCTICTCTVYTCTCTCTCIFLSLFPFPRSITCQLQHVVPSSLPLPLSLTLPFLSSLILSPLHSPPPPCSLPPVNLHIPIGSTPWKELFPVILCGVSGSLCRNERLCQSFTREYINMCTSTCMYSVHVHD